MLALGQFLKPFGVRGFVKFLPSSPGQISHLTRLPFFYCKLDECTLKGKKVEPLPPAPVGISAPQHDGYSARVIEMWDLRGQTAYCKIAGVDNPEDAASFTGLYLYAPREYAAAKEPGEHYISDLVGMRVLCEGRIVGIVRAVYPDAYAPLFEIEVADEASGGEKSTLKSMRKNTKRIVPFVSQFFSDPQIIEGAPAVTPAAGSTAGFDAPRYEIELYNPALLE